MLLNKGLDLRLQNESILYSTNMTMQRRTFYEELQNRSDIDLRDNRGKQHNLAFVLLGITLSLLRRRDGNLSSIHRSIKNKHLSLCTFLGIENEPVISRSHLPVLLSKVNLKAFEALLFSYYELKLSAQEQLWFATDGKELRGSINKGSKRGEVIVQVVEHQTREVMAQSYYNGKKESEKTCVQQLLADKALLKQKITADALHLSPAMTAPIEKEGGKYLIGLKDNQKELYEDMESASCYLTINKEQTSVEKGHGRIETRHYRQYNISDLYFDKRWKDSGFRSLVKVQRTQVELKTGKELSETAYYISNVEQSENEDCFQAIRKHWSVEVNNHIRDVTLDEDGLRTKKMKFQG